MSEIDLQSSITMTQGWKPDVQMEGATLGAMESRYTANQNKLSKLYGSLLYAPMTRSENNQARNEFFEMINNDIQKMANIDFSKAQNVTAAGNVFQSFYKNKDLVKDMAWTSNLNGEFERANAMRNCTDIVKCGGSYWEEGEKYLHYKRQEFASASREEAMSFQDPKFVPYNNMMDKAIEYANKAGLSITRDVISNGYKVTTKNGEPLKAPLTSMFGQLFRDNPQFHDMYKVQAYNSRKDWMSNEIAMGNYSSEGEAMVGYVQKNAETINNQITGLLTDIDNDAAKLNERLSELQAEYKAGKIQPGSYKETRLAELMDQAQAISEAQSYGAMLKGVQKNMNNTQNMRAIADMLDQQNAALLFDYNVKNAANTLAYKDHEQKLEEDKFALAQQKFSFDVQLEKIKHANDKDLVTWKAKNGAYNSGKSVDIVQKFSDYQGALDKAGGMSVRQDFVQKLADEQLIDRSNIEAVYKEITAMGGTENWLKQKTDGNAGIYKDIYTKLRTAKNNAVRDANEKAKAYLEAAYSAGIPMEDVTLDLAGYSKEEQLLWLSNPAIKAFDSQF